VFFDVGQIVLGEMRLHLVYPLCSLAFDAAVKRQPIFYTLWQINGVVEAEFPAVILFSVKGKETKVSSLQG
jgi:hypothetical protein